MVKHPSLPSAALPSALTLIIAVIFSTLASIAVLSISAASGFADPVKSFPRIQACPLKRYDALAPITSEQQSAIKNTGPCEDAHCLPLPDGRILCKCRYTDAEGYFSGKLYLLDLEKVVYLAEVTPFMGSTDSFLLITGDIDGEAGEEWIVANHVGTGNGLSPQVWEVFLFPALEPGRASLSWATEYFGPANFAKPVDGRKGCDILVTRWGWWVRDLSGKYFYSDGHGFYLSGQWLRLEQGKLIMHPSRNTLVRRFTFNFQQEFVEKGGFGDSRNEYWLRPGKAVVYPHPNLEVNSDELKNYESAGDNPIAQSYQLGTLPPVVVWEDTVPPQEY